MTRSSPDIVERLRSQSADATDWNGKVMKDWDNIRHIVETHEGSDLPRLMFESLIESLAELMDAASDEIERLRAAQCSAGSGDPIEKIEPLMVEITGPYLYAGDKHPSLRVAAPDRIVAIVYVVDGDEERAFAEAQMIKEAFRLGGKEIDRLHYASGVAQAETGPDLTDPVVVHANMLRGTIAKPTWENVQHLYPEEFEAIGDHIKARDAQLFVAERSPDAAQPSAGIGDADLAKRYTDACFDRSSDGASWLAVNYNMVSLIQHLRTAAQPAPMRISAPSNDQLSNLWNAIVENTKGDGFWIGEILLTTLEREVGFNPAGLTVTSTDRSTQPSQDEMENYRLALAWIRGQSADPQAKEIAATALDSFTHTTPQEPGK